MHFYDVLGGFGGGVLEFPAFGVGFVNDLTRGVDPEDAEVEVHE